MPGIRVDRRKPARPWLVGGLASLLLLWSLWEIYENPEPHPVAPAAGPPEATAMDEAPTRVEAALEPVPMPPPPTPADDSQVPVSVIVVAPSDYVARAVAGTTRIAQTWGRRGFWIEQGGQRLFVLLHDAQEAPPPKVRAGQQVRISGVVYSRRLLDRIEPAPGDDIRRLLADQAAFLLVDPRNIRIVAAAPIR